jgi:hypothetical protein
MYSEYWHDHPDSYSQELYHKHSATIPGTFLEDEDTHDISSEKDLFSLSDVILALDFCQPFFTNHSDSELCIHELVEVFNCIRRIAMRLASVPI